MSSTTHKPASSPESPGARDARPTILHLIPTMNAGGAEFQLRQNLEHFDHSKFRHILAYLWPPATLLEDFGVDKVQVECVGNGKRLSLWGNVRELRRIIRENDVRLIHTSNAIADKIGGFAGRLSDVPVIATLNTTAYSPEWIESIPGMNRWKLMYMKLTRRMVFKFLIKRFNAVSNVVARSFERSLNVRPEKVDVIYRGVDLSRFPKRPLREGAHNTDTYPQILMVARLVGEKGHRFALRALPAIKERFPGAELLFAGDGYLTDQLKQMAKELEIADSVRFLGYSDNVPDLLQEADIFLLPSIYEGCPNALLEAMAAGLPCVAASVEAVEEIAQDGRECLLTEAGDPAQIADAVIRLAEDPGYAAELGENARTLIESKFDISTAVVQLEAMYESALARSKRVKAAPGA